MATQGDITCLLEGYSRGEERASAELASLVYGQLRKIAAAQLRRERPGHSLQPTLIVNDALLELLGERRPTVRDRAHFFALAAHLMRRILALRARRKKAVKRGGGWQAVELDSELVYSDEDNGRHLALENALMRLESLDKRQARVVEMRFYAGMTIEEISRVLRISISTVNEDWKMAKAWLRRELEA